MPLGISLASLSLSTDYSENPFLLSAKEHSWTHMASLVYSLAVVAQATGTH